MKKVASWNRPTNAAKKHYHGANSVLRSHHVRWTCPSALPRVPLQEVQNHTLPSRHVLYYCVFWFPLETEFSEYQWILDVTTSNITKTSSKSSSFASNRTEFSCTSPKQWPRCRGSIRRANWWRHQLDTQRKDISSKHCSSEASGVVFVGVKNCLHVAMFFHTMTDPYAAYIILYVFWNIYKLHVA